MSDVRIERMVEGFNCAWAHWAQNSKKYQVTYLTYLAIGGRLSYIPSIECVVS